MSNLQVRNLNQMQNVVHTAQADFKKMAEIHGAVNYEREASFAMQELKEKSFLLNTACKNPDSLKYAILNVAAIGLSLSPVTKLAYLVPRDGKVCLDISYKGLIQLACEIGAIKWAVAELVYSEDEFIVNGMGERPIHNYKPFDKDRGDVIGAYCVAKTFEEEYIVTSMSIDEIFEIRNSSAAWKAYAKDKSKKNPWVTFPGEMIKKTVIKRAYKSWPLVDKKSTRLDKAVDAMNETDPIEFKEVGEEQTQLDKEKREKLHADLSNLLETKAKSLDAFLDFACRTCQRDIKSFDDLSIQELENAIELVSGFPDPDSDFKKAGGL